jgi:hypothetical protein
MRVFIDSAIVFFGTLMVAALLALAGPASVELLATGEAPRNYDAVLQVLASTQPRDGQDTTVQRRDR